MAVIEWRFMIQMVLSQAKLLEFSEILQFWLSSCILWLMDNVPVSQLALICTLKGGKYNIEASKWMVWPAAIWAALWKLFTRLSVSETIDLIFKDPVLLQLVASASFVTRCAELMAHVSVLQRDGRGWQQEARYSAHAALLLPGLLAVRTQAEVAPVPILRGYSWNSCARCV